MGLQEETGVLPQHPISLEAAAKEAEEEESLGRQPVSQLMGTRLEEQHAPSLSETTPNWKCLEMGVGLAQALLPTRREVSLGCGGR